MKTFLLIWFGQFISQIGTALTRFALLLWVYQQNQQAGLFECFQSPAYAAVTTLLVDKRQYARINALRSLAQNGAEVIAPSWPGCSSFGWG